MNIKKYFCLLIVLVVVFSSLTIYAVKYENEQYEIDIPENYIEKDSEDVKLFINTTSNFSVIVKENSNSANIVDFNEEQIKSVEDEIDKALKYANMQNEILGYEFVEINNYDALVIKNRCKMSFNDEQYVYQYKYIVTSEKYVYYITYSTNDENSIDSFNELLKTFNIKDEIIKNKDNGKEGKNKASETENRENQLNKNSSNSVYLIIILAMIAIILFVTVIIVIKKLKR